MACHISQWCKELTLIYKTIDLCAGIGGIRRGFELTGQFDNVLSAEIDDGACTTYEHLFGENPKNDLTSEEFKELAAKTEYDVLLAGFPCQTFSKAGGHQAYAQIYGSFPAEYISLASGGQSRLEIAA